MCRIISMKFIFFQRKNWKINSKKIEEFQKIEIKYVRELSEFP